MYRRYCFLVLVLMVLFSVTSGVAFADMRSVLGLAPKIAGGLSEVSPGVFLEIEVLNDSRFSGTSAIRIVASLNVGIRKLILPNVETTS
jgi:hypothetical protein